MGSRSVSRTTNKTMSVTSASLKRSPLSKTCSVSVTLKSIIGSKRKDCKSRRVYDDERGDYPSPSVLRRQDRYFDT